MPQTSELKVTETLLKSIIKEQAASESESRGSGNFYAGLLLVLASCAILYAAFALSWVKFSRAEVFFAECAREMISANNMVTPLYHGKPFFDKPILVYWLIVSAFKALGVSHFVARIPSMIAALGTVALTATAARALATTRRNIVGLTAAMLCGSSFMFLSFAYLCMSDMFLVLFDTATLMFLYAGLQTEKRRTLLWWLASVSMGLAFITKGPVGVVLPAVSFLAYAGITKQLKTIRAVHVGLGAITLLVLAIPWFYAAYQANGSWALAYFFIRENFQRYAGSTYDTHKPIWFMVVSLFTGFLPWSPFLIPAAVRLAKSCKLDFASVETKKQLFLWTWLVVVTAFFSVSRGKIDYYVLPAYPAAAILVASYLHSFQGNNVSPLKTPRWLTGILSVLAIAAGVLSPLLLSVLLPGQTLADYWLTPACLTVSGLVGLVATLKAKPFAAITALFCAVTFGGAAFASQAMPTISKAQSIDFYASVVRQSQPVTGIGVHKTLAHWVDELTFQSAREPQEIKDADSMRKLFGAGPAILLIPETDYLSLLSDDDDLQSLNLKVMDKRNVSVKPLTPGSIYKRKGKIHDMTLLLISNR